MRIGISLPDSLLSKFDEIIEKRGYSSRSEGVRDSIRNYIANCEWADNVKGHHVGTVAFIYDTTKKGLFNALTNIQHRYSHLIKSSVHIELGQNDCFEVVVLDGDGEEITEFADAMTSLKGVKISKLTTLASNKQV